MRSNSKLLVLSAVLILGATFLWMGCSPQQPTAAAVSAPVTDVYTLLNITNTKATVNPNISNLNGNGTSGSIVEVASWLDPVTVCAGAAPVGFYLIPPGYGVYNEDAFNTQTASSFASGNRVYSGGCTNVATVGYTVSFVQTGLTDGYDGYGIHVSGMINDPQSPLYPPGAGNLDEVELELFPSGSAYDLAAYQGIEFYLYIYADDSTVDKVFNAYVANNVPTNTGNGNCFNNQTGPLANPNQTHCYDGFEYDYTNTPRGQWVLIQKYWGDLKQYGFGSIADIPTLSGANLADFDFFAWTEENAYADGPYTVDYTIAGIRFF